MNPPFPAAPPAIIGATMMTLLAERVGLLWGAARAIRARRRTRAVAAATLVAFPLLGSLVAIDWLMSLDLHLAMLRTSATQWAEQLEDYDPKKRDPFLGLCGGFSAAVGERLLNCAAPALSGTGVTQGDNLGALIFDVVYTLEVLKPLCARCPLARPRTLLLITP